MLTAAQCSMALAPCFAFDTHHLCLPVFDLYFFLHSRYHLRPWSKLTLSIFLHSLLTELDTSP